MTAASGNLLFVKLRDDVDADDVVNTVKIEATVELDVDGEGRPTGVIVQAHDGFPFSPVPMKRYPVE